MKLHYYADTDSLDVEFQERPSVDTLEIAADVRLDLAAEGRPVGLKLQAGAEIAAAVRVSVKTSAANISNNSM